MAHSPSHTKDDSYLQAVGEREDEYDMPCNKMMMTTTIITPKGILLALTAHHIIFRERPTVTLSEY